MVCRDEAVPVAGEPDVGERIAPCLYALHGEGNRLVEHVGRVGIDLPQHERLGRVVDDGQGHLVQRHVIRGEDAPYLLESVGLDPDGLALEVLDAVDARVRQHEQAAGVLLERRPEALVGHTLADAEDHVARLRDDPEQGSAVGHRLTRVSRGPRGDDVNVQPVLLEEPLLSRAVVARELGVVYVALLQRHGGQTRGGLSGGLPRRGVEDATVQRQHPHAKSDAAGLNQKCTTIHTATPCSFQ